MYLYERTDKMFVLTIKTKIKKPERLITLLVFALLLIGGIVYVICDGGSSTAVCKGVGEYSLKFATDRDKQKFWSTFNAEGTLVTIDSVKIPQEFNKVYEDYNKLQKKMGLDLDKYRGTTAKRFVYETEDDMYVSVLTHKGKVIACHKCTNIYGDEFQALCWYILDFYI